jgi:hypothetical protein
MVRKFYLDKTYFFFLFLNTLLYHPKYVSDNLFNANTTSETAVRATPTVLHSCLTFLFFGKKLKMKAPTIYHMSLVFLGSWQFQATDAHICARGRAWHPPFFREWTTS